MSGLGRVCPAPNLHFPKAAIHVTRRIGQSGLTSVAIAVLRTCVARPLEKVSAEAIPTAAMVLGVQSYDPSQEALDVGPGEEQGSPQDSKILKGPFRWRVGL